MSRFRMIFAITATMLLILVAAEAFLCCFFPTYMFKGHLAVPLFFWLFYVSVAFLVKKGMNDVQMLRFFIGVKAVKMFVSLVFVTVLAFVYREQLLAIVFNFLLYYLLLLIPETICCVSLKKHIKNNLLNR